MSEKAIEENVNAWLAFQGYIPLKVGHEGYPDRCIILGSGRYIWFEYKKPGGMLRPQQVNRIFKLREMGEGCYVIESLEQAQHVIAELRLPSPLSTLSR